MGIGRRKRGMETLTKNTAPRKVSGTVWYVFQPPAVAALFLIGFFSVENQRPTRPEAVSEGLVAQYTTIGDTIAVICPYIAQLLSEGRLSCDTPLWAPPVWLVLLP